MKWRNMDLAHSFTVTGIKWYNSDIIAAFGKQSSLNVRLFRHIKPLQDKLFIRRSAENNLKPYTDISHMSHSSKICPPECSSWSDDVTRTRRHTNGSRYGYDAMTSVGYRQRSDAWSAAVTTNTWYATLAFAIIPVPVRTDGHSAEQGRWF